MKEEAKEVAKKAMKKKIMAFIIANLPIILGVIFTIFGTIILFVVLMQPIESATNWVKTAGQNVASFFEKYSNFLKGNGWSDDEQAFLNSLDKKSKYYRNVGVTIDVPLIMSTLMTKQLFTNEDPEEKDLGEDYEDFDENRADVNEIPYNNMIGDMRKLVEHQVHKTFRLPSNADPSVYETMFNPPFAILNAAANLLNTTIDNLTSNVRSSNANYLAYLRFGTYATKEQLDQEKNTYSTTISGGNSGNIRLTNFIDYQVGWNSMSPYGNKSERFSLNEKGWWMYFDPDTNKEYLAVAAPTTYCLGTGCGKTWPALSGITYYEYGDIINLNINGESVEAMVIDSCGACMEATNPLKIDVYVTRDYFGENGMTSAGVAAGAVMPDTLPTTMGDVSVMNTDDEGFWKYIEPTEEEKSRVNDYKNGYVYKTYRSAFKTANGKDLEGDALVQKAEEIIETIYEMRTSYLDYAKENGLVADDSPIEQRTTAPNRTNSFYYDQATGYGAAGTLEGECAWYGTARAKEFLASINSPETWTANPNGGQFCDTADAQKFNTGMEPKAGSLVSWTGTSQWGHVAFVENVNPDGTFDISEAFIGMGIYGRSARGIVSGNNAARRANCEGNGTGCVNFQKGITTTYPYSGLKCFIYLREPKSGGY